MIGSAVTKSHPRGDAPKYGWWSDEAYSQGCATSFWRSVGPNGKYGPDIEVCGVSSDPNLDDVKWPDRLMLGLVDDLVRPGRKDETT